MQCIGIICEYNPFHNGHAYQIRRLKEQYPEAAVLCIMSGAFVQRGEPALLSPEDRARMALSSGADLVVELPFPYSMAPAELFARGGVSLLSDLGAEGICFGGETASLSALSLAAQALSDDAFQTELRAAARSPLHARTGYPLLRDRLLSRQYGEETAALLRTPNNTLAVEYLRANRGLATPLTPILIPRIGVDHDAAEADDATKIASASAIRGWIRDMQTEKAAACMPREAYAILTDAIAGGRVAVDLSRADGHLLWFYRTHTQEALTAFVGMSGGVSGRLCGAASAAAGIADLLSAAATKKYTHAALRRAMWSGFLGVRDTDMGAPPSFCRLLGATDVGTAHLRATAKTRRVPLLLRPADARSLSPEARYALSLDRRARLFWETFCQKPFTEAELYRVCRPCLPNA